MPIILAQYGRPITVYKATHGVKTVTARFSKLLITYEKLARHRTNLELNLKKRIKY